MMTAACPLTHPFGCPPTALLITILLTSSLFSLSHFLTSPPTTVTSPTISNSLPSAHRPLALQI